LVCKHLNYLGVTNNDQKSDSSTDLLTLKHILIQKLDPFIRLQVKKRGVTIFQNVYTGFDTEYELEDYHKSLNKLISTQIAVQSRTIIKVPLYKPLDISYIHPLTSEISTNYQPKIEEWSPPSITGEIESDSKRGKPVDELKILNESLKVSVESVRKEMFISIDNLHDCVIDGLKSLKGVISYEDGRNDALILSLPLTPIQTKINYPLNGYSLVDLLQDSKTGCVESISQSFNDILKIFNSNGMENDLSKIVK
jgi:hypothetical protein